MAEETMIAGPQLAPGQSPAPDVRPRTGVGRPPRREPKLRRADMEKIIRTGGSILHNGEIIAHEDDLPDDADLARGDAARTAESVEAIDAEMDRLAAAKSRVLAQQASDLRAKPEPKLTDKPKA